MRLRPVSALTICVTFTGMLAVIGLVAITARSLPKAIAVAAATDAGALETHETRRVLSKAATADRITFGDAIECNARGQQ